MKGCLILVMALLLSVRILAQDTLVTPELNIPDKIYAYCEQMPEPGYNVHDFIGENLSYPPRAYKKYITGRVNVMIVVDTTGNIHYVKTINSENVDSELIEEAIRVVSLLPAWEKPGIMKGVPVNVYYTIPINFAIEKKKAKKKRR